VLWFARSADQNRGTFVTEEPIPAQALFGVLATRSMMAPEICERLDADPVVVEEFLEAMVAQGLLSRIGENPEDFEYRSAADAEVLTEAFRQRAG
jgi:hypothetical protein